MQITFALASILSSAAEAKSMSFNIEEILKGNCPWNLGTSDIMRFAILGNGIFKKYTFPNKCWPRCPARLAIWKEQTAFYKKIIFKDKFKDNPAIPIGL